MKKFLSVFLSLCMIVSCMVGFSVTAGATPMELSTALAANTKEASNGLVYTTLSGEYTVSSSFDYDGSYGNIRINGDTIINIPEGVTFSIISDNNGYPIWVNQGNLTIIGGGTLISEYNIPASNISRSAICVDYGKTLTIDGVTFKAKGTKDSTDGIYFDSYYQGSLIVQNGATIIDTKIDSESNATTKSFKNTTLINCTVDGETKTGKYNSSSEFTAGVPYMDANGKTDVSGAYTPVTSSTTSWSAGWYVVNDDVTINNGESNRGITTTGDVNLILCDGKKLSVTGKHGIVGNNYNITVYGQSVGSGTLEAKGIGNNQAGIITSYGNVTINGGTVITSGYYGIFSENLTINGGTVTAAGTSQGTRTKGLTIKGGNTTFSGSSGVWATGGNGAVVLNWTKPTDWIKADSIDNTNSITFTNPFVLEGTDTLATADNIAGKTLVPACSFNTNIGEPIGVAINPTTGKVTPPTPATINGLTFDGWYADGGCTGEKFDFTTPITTTTAFYGSYVGEYIEPRYTNPAKTLSGFTLVTSDTTEWDGDMVVAGNVTISSGVELMGNAQLHLCDGATLTIGSESSPIDGKGIFDNGEHYLRIYGQENESGVLNIYSTGRDIETGDYLTIIGGKVNAKKGTGFYAKTNIDISGGKVNSDCTNGVDLETTAGGLIEFHWYDSWENAKPSINLGSITANGGTVTIGDQPFVLSGTNTLATEDNIAGKTIVPAYKVTFAVGNPGFMLSVENVARDQARNEFYKGAAATGNATVTPLVIKSGDNVYSVSEWYTDPQLTTASKFDFSKPVTADTTLYPKWGKNIDGYITVEGLTYNGKEQEPKVWYTPDENTKTLLVKGTDYTIKYFEYDDKAKVYNEVTKLKNSIGCRVEVTGIGEYAGVYKAEDCFIAPKTITVTVDDKTKVQGDPDPEFTYKVVGLCEGDTLPGEFLREEGEEPGTYEIAFIDRQYEEYGYHNYNLGEQAPTGTLTITERNSGGENNNHIRPFIPIVTVTDDKPEDKVDITKPITPDKIVDAVKQAPEGSTVKVDMTKTTVLPKDAIEAIKGKDVDVVLDMGNGIKWTINGKNIDSAIGDINMAVTVGKADIPVDVINNVTGERYNKVISIAHNGPFGFKATLTVQMRAEDAGMYANLYYFNPDTGDVELISSGKINGDGTVDLEFNHASDYIIVIDDHPLGETIAAAFDGSSVKLTWAPVAGAESYNVYQAKDGKWVKLGTTKELTYTVYKLTNNKTYNFMVRARVGGKLKTKADSYRIKVKVCYKPVLTATFRNSKITLKWTQVNNATKYRVYEYVNGKWELVKTTKKLTMNVSGAKSGSTHKYAVKAYVNGKWTSIGTASKATVKVK